MNKLVLFPKEVIVKLKALWHSNKVSALDTEQRGALALLFNNTNLSVTKLCKYSKPDYSIIYVYVNLKFMQIMPLTIHA